jgi:superfamily II DNA/RNA helicase
LHDLSQAQRDGVMKSLRGTNQMLVTDVAARGIDVDNITRSKFNFLTK